MEEIALRRSPADLLGYPGVANELYSRVSNDDQTDWFVVMVMGCGILMICCGIFTIGEWCRRHKQKVMSWFCRNRAVP